jgi:oxepin-CoA hydrolase/3-oxo-5,6-dehydrosuberyl-CoA semialdehyde dehydrogenase
VPLRFSVNYGEAMQLIRFDVNDAALRDRFDRTVLREALDDLAEGAEGRWGRMTAQQMVEHLEWTYGLSTGKHQVECQVAEADRARLKRFLYHTMPTPHDFSNPALTGGLPLLKHANLKVAKDALGREVERFWTRSPELSDALYMHPLFGPIGMEEWSRTHFKHGCHHLLQFGLIELTEASQKSV